MAYWGRAPGGELHSEAFSVYFKNGKCLLYQLLYKCCHFKEIRHGSVISTSYWYLRAFPLINRQHWGGGGAMTAEDCMETVNYVIEVESQVIVCNSFLKYTVRLSSFQWFVGGVVLQEILIKTWIWQGISICNQSIDECHSERNSSLFYSRRVCIFRL